MKDKKINIKLNIEKKYLNKLFNDHIYKKIEYENQKIIKICGFIEIIKYDDGENTLLIYNDKFIKYFSG